MQNYNRPTFSLEGHPIPTSRADGGRGWNWKIEKRKK